MLPESRQPQLWTGLPSTCVPRGDLHPDTTQLELTLTRVTHQAGSWDTVGRLPASYSLQPGSQGQTQLCTLEVLLWVQVLGWADSSLKAQGALLRI